MPEANWKWRRIAVYVAAGVALLNLTCLTLAAIFRGTDNALARDIVSMSGMILSTVLPAYIGGAYLDDKDRRRYTMPPGEQPTPPQQPPR